MTNVPKEITALEERLRLAELGPDPKVFEELLADDLVVVAENGQPFFAKKKIVEAHQPGQGSKFTRVEINELRIVDHGTAAVVTCQGVYDGPQGSFTLTFMRVWAKTDGGWQIIAGAVSK